MKIDNATKLLLVFYLLMCTVILGCGTTKKAITDIATWSIELKKGGCLDNCISYNIVIRQDGSYLYNGKYNVKYLGDKSGKLGTKKIAVIDGLVTGSNWNSFKSEYGTQAEDSQRKEINYNADRINKKVVYFRMEPQEIKEIETYLDILIQSDEF